MIPVYIPKRSFIIIERVKEYRIRFYLFIYLLIYLFNYLFIYLWTSYAVYHHQRLLEIILVFIYGLPMPFTTARDCEK